MAAFATAGAALGRVDRQRRAVCGRRVAAVRTATVRQVAVDGWAANEEEVFDVVETVYENKADEYAPTYRLLAAREEQERQGILGQSSVTYGEYDLRLFGKLLKAAQPKPGEVFYDLGSGVGRLVLAAGLLYPPFSACKGIELLPNLHEKGLKYFEDFEGLDPPHPAKPLLGIECGDFEEADLTDADVVFCYSTTWAAVGATLSMVSRKLGEDLKLGARCITADKTLAEIAGDGVGFELLEKIEGPNTDTGDSMGYVFRKVAR
mmetsp:Transcript_30944/g.75674  ORF Transcript_30944/g.75674 Transcript_30944/m.75674 type:complete len:263 (-) Transcript_30944:617-1405(-)